MSNRDWSVAELCRELRIKPVMLCRYVGPDSELRKHGKQVIGGWRRISPPFRKRPLQALDTDGDASISPIENEQSFADMCHGLDQDDE